jgi:hypothetical protein
MIATVAVVLVVVLALVTVSWLWLIGRIAEQQMDEEVVRPEDDKE